MSLPNVLAIFANCEAIALIYGVPPAPRFLLHHLLLRSSASPPRPGLPSSRPSTLSLPSESHRVSNPSYLCGATTSFAPSAHGIPGGGGAPGGAPTAAPTATATPGSTASSVLTATVAMATLTLINIGPVTSTFVVAADHAPPGALASFVGVAAALSYACSALGFAFMRFAAHPLSKAISSSEGLDQQRAIEFACAGFWSLVACVASWILIRPHAAREASGGAGSARDDGGAGADARERRAAGEEGRAAAAASLSSSSLLGASGRSSLGARDSVKKLILNPSSILVGEVIGRGGCGVVRRARMSGVDVILKGLHCRPT